MYFSTLIYLWVLIYFLRESEYKNQYILLIAMYKLLHFYWTIYIQYNSSVLTKRDDIQPWTIYGTVANRVVLEIVHDLYN
jgi:hypothetical protein